MEPFFEPSVPWNNSSIHLYQFFELRNNKFSKTNVASSIHWTFSANHDRTIIPTFGTNNNFLHPSVPTLWTHTEGDHTNFVIWNERWATNLGKCENVKM